MKQTKTPEELYFEKKMQEYTTRWEGCPYVLGSIKGITALSLANCDGYEAGYNAAWDEWRAGKLFQNQDHADAVYKEAAKDQLADADKVMCNTTMEEVKAVDTGELMPITNLPTSAKWISVKERLPEHFEDVLTFEDGECYRVNSISELTKYWWDSDEGFERHPSHWMPLPEPPKE